MGRVPCFEILASLFKDLLFEGGSRCSKKFSSRTAARKNFLGLLLAVPGHVPPENFDRIG